ncbi:MAG: NosD domain-containing protein, partial [Candidatus Aenigmatarchaeota archaeon]
MSVEERIVDILSKHPEGLTITNISKELNIHRNTTSKYIFALAKAGIIDQRRIGKVALCSLKKQKKGFFLGKKSIAKLSLAILALMIILIFLFHYTIPIKGSVDKIFNFTELNGYRLEIELEKQKFFTNELIKISGFFGLTDKTSIENQSLSLTLISSDSLTNQIVSTDLNGTFSLSFNLNQGNYTIVASSGELEASLNFEVLEIPFNITLEKSVFKANETVSIFVKGEANKEFTLEIFGQEITENFTLTTDEKGFYIFNKTFPSGNYSARILSSEASFEVLEEKEEIKLELISKEFYYLDENITLIVSGTPDQKFDLSVFKEGLPVFSFLGQTNSSGLSEIYFKLFEKGNYSAILKYGEKEELTIFEVLERIENISIEEMNASAESVNEDVKFEIITDKKVYLVNESVKVKIRGSRNKSFELFVVNPYDEEVFRLFGVTDEKGEFDLEIKNGFDIPGIYIITLVYNSNSFYGTFEIIENISATEKSYTKSLLSVEEVEIPICELVEADEDFYIEIIECSKDRIAGYLTFNSSSEKEILTGNFQVEGLDKEYIKKFEKDFGFLCSSNICIMKDLRIKKNAGEDKFYFSLDFKKYALKLPRNLSLKWGLNSSTVSVSVGSVYNVTADNYIVEIGRTTSSSYGIERTIYIDNLAFPQVIASNRFINIRNSTDQSTTVDLADHPSTSWVVENGPARVELRFENKSTICVSTPEVLCFNFTIDYYLYPSRYFVKYYVEGNFTAISTGSYGFRPLYFRSISSTLPNNFTFYGAVENLQGILNNSGSLYPAGGYTLTVSFNSSYAFLWNTSHTKTAATAGTVSGFYVTTPPRFSFENIGGYNHTAINIVGSSYLYQNNVSWGWMTWFGNSGGGGLELNHTVNNELNKTFVDFHFPASITMETGTYLGFNKIEGTYNFTPSSNIVNFNFTLESYGRIQPVFYIKNLKNAVEVASHVWFKNYTAGNTWQKLTNGTDFIVQEGNNTYWGYEYVIVLMNKTYTQSTNSIYEFWISNSTDPPICDFYISSCSNLDQTNKYYCLSNNISSPGTCINITANSITLDCQGYWINYSQSSTGYAINITGYNNIVIKSCNIVQGSSTLSSSHAIYGSRMNNSLIFNNSIITSGSSSDGISLNFGFDNNISLNTISTSGSNCGGMYINSSSNNIITSNIITTSGAPSYGVYLDSSTNATLTFNKLNTSKANSLIVEGTIVNHFNHSIDQTNLAEGLPIYYCFNCNNAKMENQDYSNTYGQIIFAWSKNVTINNITMSNDGFNFFNVSYSKIENSSVATSRGRGIFLYSNSILNNVTNNTISTTNSYGYGIYLYSSSRNILASNTISTTNSYSHGIYLYSSSNYNTITSNVVTTSHSTSSHGIYLYSSSRNNITGGSYLALGRGSSYDFYLRGASSTNNFTNTNFTAPRRIYFYDNTSWFNYNNRTDIELWLKTRISSAAAINRSLIKWTQQEIKWNENASTTITAYYEINGLYPNQEYKIYNGSELVYTQNATSTGNLTFNLTITTDIREITVNTTADLEPPLIQFVPPTPANNSIVQNNFVYVNTTITDASNTSAFIDWNYSLVGYWSFDWYNSSGVFDNSTYNNFGFFQGGLGIDNITTGQYGKGLRFDGVDDRVNISHSSNLDLTDEFTFEAWIYPTGWGENNYGRIIDKNYSSAYAFYVSNTSTNVQTLRVGIGNSAYSPPNYTIELNRWQHVVVTFNRYLASAQIKFYVNGSLVGTATRTTSVPVNTEPLYIGNRDGLDRTFNGIIDEVRIWSRALAPEEVNASYNSGLYRLYRNFTNLSDGTYQYYAYAIDAAGNANKTETRTVTVDTTPPFYSLNSTNSTIAGTAVSHNLFWQDNYGLSHAIFSFDNCTGEFQNISEMSLSGTQAWSNFTVVINETVGCLIKWKVYANDTSNNWNETEVFSYTTTSSSPCQQYISSCSDLNQPNTYYCLNQSILDSSSIACINISANNITLDCQGYTIDGTSTSDTYGIYISRSSSQNTNITIKNCIVTGWDDGIHLEYANNNSIINSNFSFNVFAGFYLYKSSNNYIINSVFNNNSEGIYHDYSSNNYIINSIVNFNGGEGIYLEAGSNNQIINSTFNFNYYGMFLISSSSNRIINSTFNNNLDTGFWLDSASNNQIINSTMSENELYDFNLYAYFLNECNNELENVLGSGNKPIKYFNSSVTFSNEVLSELILCNADYSNITNITIDASPSKQNNGMLVILTDYSNFSRINSSFNFHGVYLEDSSNNQIINSTFNSNYYGVELITSSSIGITDTSIASNTEYDYYLALSGSTNNFTNTNFTAPRKIYFEAPSSNWFNYNNRTDIELWLKTSVSSSSTLTRKLISWEKSLMIWNDSSSSAITAFYNISGLNPNKYYLIYNNSVLTYTLKTDSSGSLSFTIYLSGEREIKVQETPCEVYINSLPYNITQNNTYYCLNTSSSDLAGTAIQFGNSSSWVIQNSTLDCQGFAIDGNHLDYGVLLNDSAAINNEIKNCIITDFSVGIEIIYASNTKITNVSVSSCSSFGIHFWNSVNNILTDSKAFDTHGGWLYDFYVLAENIDSRCNHIVTNLNGTDDKPIVYYNSTVVIENWYNNVSEIFLCNADYSIIRNITMVRSGTKNNGIVLMRTDYSNITNIYIKNFGTGIMIRSSDNNNITNVTLVSNNDGIRFYFSNGNTITSSIIQDNSRGIRVGYSGSIPNKIYNNLFNNTNNFYFEGTIYSNYWNTTKQSGQRIYSAGNEIGGNYWTNFTNNGYSDTCDDDNKDGFCDSPYIIDPGQTGNNTDYLPLSNKGDITSPTIIWELPTPPNNSITSNNWVYLNTTITDASNTSAFIDWNYSLVGYWSFDWYNSSGVFDNSTYNNFGF